MFWKWSTRRSGSVWENTHTSSCIGVSHRGRTRAVVISTPCQPDHSRAVTRCDMSDTAQWQHHLTLCSWLEVNRCEREGPGRERKRGEQGSYLAKAVCLWCIETLLSQVTSPQQYTVHPLCLHARDTDSVLRPTGNHWTFILRSSYDLSYTVIVSCFGFVYTFFKVTLDFWSSLPCLIKSRSWGGVVILD